MDNVKIVLAFSRSLVVPGSGCGVTKGLKLLERSSTTGQFELSSGSDADCTIASSQKNFEEIVQQAEVLKCIQGQMDCADMICKDSIPQTLNLPLHLQDDFPDNVLANSSACSDPGSLSVLDPTSDSDDIPDCTIVDKTKFNNLMADKLSSTCPSGDPACLENIGIDFTFFPGLFLF